MNELSIIFGVVFTSIYFILGMGVARVSAKAKSYQVRFFDFIVWPIVLLVWAIVGDISD